MSQEFEKKAREKTNELRRILDQCPSCTLPVPANIAGDILKIPKDIFQDIRTKNLVFIINPAPDGYVYFSFTPKNLDHDLLLEVTKSSGARTRWLESWYLTLYGRLQAEDWETATQVYRESSTIILNLMENKILERSELFKRDVENIIHRSSNQITDIEYGEKYLIALWHILSILPATTKKIQTFGFTPQNLRASLS